MGIAPLNTTQPTQVRLGAARELLRPLLQQGKLAEAQREVRILRDSGHAKDIYPLLKVIAALLQGNGQEARRDMEATSSEDIEAMTKDEHYDYSRFLVDTAICLALNGGNQEAIDVALTEASQSLLDRSEELVVIEAVIMLVLLQEGNTGTARIHYINMTSAWLHAKTVTVLQWKQVFDLAMYQATGDRLYLDELLSVKAPDPFIQRRARELERQLNTPTWIKALQRWVRTTFRRTEAP